MLSTVTEGNVSSVSTAGQSLVDDVLCGRETNQKSYTNNMSEWTVLELQTKSRVAKT